MSLSSQKCHVMILPHHTHYAHITHETDLTVECVIEYDNRMVGAEIITPLLPGLYGFTSKKARDRLIHRANAAHGEEIGYIAALSTGPVEDNTEQRHGEESSSGEGTDGRTDPD